jgi:hypothetical protein
MPTTPTSRAAGRDRALDRILRRAPGTASRIAEACGISRAAVAQWRSVPQRHLRTVAKFANVPVESLVPRKQRAAERERKAPRKPMAKRGKR